VYVDDASRDDTLAVLREARGALSATRVVRHLSQSGQSTAVRTGVKARARRLDRDARRRRPERPGRHPEAPRRARRGRRARALFAGWRVSRPRRLRQAHLVEGRERRALAPAARTRRRTPAAGSSCSSARCSSSCRISRHMHRFLPALVQRAGFKVPRAGRHRPRTRGVSKYGMWNRLWVGISDLRRRRLADPPLAPHRDRGELMNDPISWLEWTGLVVTPWKMIGYLGAFMFGFRWFVQFDRAPRRAKPVSPHVLVHERARS
jgi:dolichol-phosphate mannosyltransferase